MGGISVQHTSPSTFSCFLLVFRLHRDEPLFALFANSAVTESVRFRVVQHLSLKHTHTHTHTQTHTLLAGKNGEQEGIFPSNYVEITY